MERMHTLSGRLTIAIKHKRSLSSPTMESVDACASHLDGKFHIFTTIIRCFYVRRTFAVAQTLTADAYRYELNFKWRIESHFNYRGLADINSQFIMSCAVQQSTVIRKKCVLLRLMNTFRVKVMVQPSTTHRQRTGGPWKVVQINTRKKRAKKKYKSF